MTNRNPDQRKPTPEEFYSVDRRAWDWYEDDHVILQWVPDASTGSLVALPQWKSPSRRDDLPTLQPTRLDLGL